MRTRQERRYLTEKYQNKQVRIAYATAYAKPHDYDRYGRSKFAHKRRFVDVLRGNYVEWETPWSKRYALNNSGWDRHEWTKEELGRLRDRAWSNCGNKRCCYCWYCNPRRGHWGKKEITKQEHIANLHLKEELRFYKERKNEKVKSIIAR